MRLLSTTERRVIFAILLTALIPLGAAVLLARAMIGRISATAFQPEFGVHLDQALGVYADLARALKQGMRAEAETIAAGLHDPPTAGSRDGAATTAGLERALAAHPALASLALVGCDGAMLGRRDRGRPIDPAAEREFTVRRALDGAAASAATDAPADAPGEADAPCVEGAAGKPRVLVATFATPRARFDELEAAQAFAQAYHQLERNHREENVDQAYGKAFVVLFASTILLAIAAGVLVARPVTRRLARLVAATRPVAEGDLTVRVRLEGHDEVADLGRAFDRMLEEFEQSRARVEFLRRVGQWQQMARRLAHEIKNPLTPIQLAVQECHRRYEGDDPAYRRIVQTTMEVVEEEVGTLRRLVGEFSSFARLPRAELHPEDLGEFLRQQRDHFLALCRPDERDATAFEAAPDDGPLFAHVDIAFALPDGPMPASLDVEALHRVLGNLLRNAAQAMRDAQPRGAGEPPGEAGASGGRWGRIQVTATEAGGHYVIDVDDEGPGIPAEARAAVFDPYVTTKRDGTGLGLSIVKKIVVDHGGGIDALDGPLGGARFRIRLPRAGTAEALAAAEHRAEPDSIEGVASAR